MWRKTSFNVYRQKTDKKIIIELFSQKKNTHIAVMKVIGIINTLVAWDNVHTQERQTNSVFRFYFLKNITFVVALIMCSCPHFFTYTF